MSPRYVAASRTMSTNLSPILQSYTIHQHCSRHPGTQDKIKSPQNDINATPNKARHTPQVCTTDNRSPIRRNPARNAPVYTTSNTTVDKDRLEDLLDTQPHNNPVPKDGTTGIHHGNIPTEIPLANPAPKIPVRNNDTQTQIPINNSSNLPPTHNRILTPIQCINPHKHQNPTPNATPTYHFIPLPTTKIPPYRQGSVDINPIDDDKWIHGHVSGATTAPSATQNIVLRWRKQFIYKYCLSS